MKSETIHIKGGCLTVAYVLACILLGQAVIVWVVWNTAIHLLNSPYEMTYNVAMLIVVVIAVIWLAFTGTIEKRK